MKRFLGAGVWLFAGIMLGRILGLVRDVIIGNQFGVGVEADRAVFVITIPDVMINILIGGAMGAALIPEFKRRNAEENWALLRQSSGLVLVIVGIVTAALILSAEWLTRTLVSGLPEDAIPGTAKLVMVALLAVPITAVSAVVRARLQGEERFAVPSLAGFFYNLMIVAGLVFASGIGNLTGLAVAAVLGAGLSLLMQVWDAWRFCAPGVRAWQIEWGLVGRFLGALVAGMMILIVPVALRGFASANGVGGQTTAYLASKLVELPMGTLLSVVSIAMFPAVAEALAKEDGFDEARYYAQQGIGVILALSVPIALGMGVFAQGFADLLYRHGEMTIEDARLIAQMGAVMMVGLIPQAVNTMLLAIFNGYRDMWTPFWISLIGLAVFLGFGFAGVIELMSLAWLYSGFHWVVMLGLLCSLGVRHKMWLLDAFVGGQALIRMGTTVGVFGICFVGLQQVNVFRLPPIVVVLLAIGAGGFAMIGGLMVDGEIRGKVKGVILRKMGRS